MIDEYLKVEVCIRYDCQIFPSIISVCWITLIGKINVFSYFAKQGRKSLSCTPKWLECVKQIFLGVLDK